MICCTLAAILIGHIVALGTAARAWFCGTKEGASFAAAKWRPGLTTTAANVAESRGFRLSFPKKAVLSGAAASAIVLLSAGAGFFKHSHDQHVSTFGIQSILANGRFCGRI